MEEMTGIDQGSTEQEAQEFPGGIPVEVPMSDHLRKQMLRLCLKRASSLTGIDGSERSFYFDIDYLLGHNARADTPDQFQTTAAFLGAVEHAIREVSAAQPIDALAFPLRRKQPGPTGLISSAVLLGRRTGLPTYYIDPTMRLRAQQVRPIGPTPPNTRFTIVTDMTASGREVMESAQALFQHRCRYIGAISIFDTGEGAREYLDQAAGIPLTTIMSGGGVYDMNAPES